MATLYTLLEQAKNTTVVEDNISSLEEHQELVHQPMKVIAVFEQDDKVKAPFGRNVALCATSYQSLCTIVIY